MHWMLCFPGVPLQKVGAKLDTGVLMHSTRKGSGRSLRVRK